MSIPRVNSAASELNDFTETPDGKKEYNVSKSRLIRLINWVHVLQAYRPILVFTVIGLAAIMVFLKLHHFNFQLSSFVLEEMTVLSTHSLSALKTATLTQLLFDWKLWLLVAFLFWLSTKRGGEVLLLNFTVFEPPDSWRLSPQQVLEIMRLQGCYTQESLDFMDRMLTQSGVGSCTAWPPGIVRCLRGESADFSTEASRRESEVVMFDCVERLLKSTNTKAKDVDILIINCSLFSPTPSLCSMVVNHFKMRSDISSYNLSGMGCSAGLISVELAKNLLAARPNSTALIVSTEIITPNLYHGNERAFLLQNTLFRCGGAAILLSNKWSDALRARFKLLHVTRTQTVNEDSYGCVYETEDAEHYQGVRLSKDIVKIAGRAMEANFTSIGPYILPLSEQLKTVFSMAKRIIAKKLNALLGLSLPKVNPYIPDFKRGIDHFCIHAGGRGVIDGIEKNLQLRPTHVEASRHTLYTYGNTSSSSIWYEMQYVCDKLKIRRGQRVLQLAFGSGFKCNSAVWICLNNNSSKFRHNGADKSKKDD